MRQLRIPVTPVALLAVLRHPPQGVGAWVRIRVGWVLRKRKKGGGKKEEERRK